MTICIKKNGWFTLTTNHSEFLLTVVIHIPDLCHMNVCVCVCKKIRPTEALLLAPLPLPQGLRNLPLEHVISNSRVFNTEIKLDTIKIFV